MQLDDLSVILVDILIDTVVTVLHISMKLVTLRQAWLVLGWVTVGEFESL